MPSALGIMLTLDDSIMYDLHATPTFGYTAEIYSVSTVQLFQTLVSLLHLAAVSLLMASRLILKKDKRKRERTQAS